MAPGWIDNSNVTCYLTFASDICPKEQTRRLQRLNALRVVIAVNINGRGSRAAARVGSGEQRLSGRQVNERKQGGKKEGNRRETQSYR